MKGIGVDIIQVNRVSEELARKVLVGNESFDNAQHFAGLWAVKEAALKALGCGISAISFQDIEIRYTIQGAPTAVLSNRAMGHLADLGATQMLVSISHEKDYAVGMAIID